MSVGIGNKLKQLRTERGLTQKELAAKVAGGLDYTYIGKIEREEQLPSLKILIRLSEALQMPLSAFFQDDENVASSFPSFGKLVKLAEAREIAALTKELNRLHKEDVPLLAEIVKALNSHRKNRLDCGCSGSNEKYSLVAEQESGYEGDV